MGKIVTYNSPITGNPNQCFCQIKFESGERILISQARDGIKILKLLLGIFPKETIFEASIFDDKNNIFLNGKSKSPLLMDSYVENIVTMKSIKELKEFINIII